MRNHDDEQADVGFEPNQVLGEISSSKNSVDDENKSNEENRYEIYQLIKECIFIMAWHVSVSFFDLTKSRSEYDAEQNISLTS